MTSIFLTRGLITVCMKNSELILIAGEHHGYHFAVWAPNARMVTVTGDFNEWKIASHQLQPLGQSGIWTGMIPGITQGSLYKYHVYSQLMTTRSTRPILLLSTRRFRRTPLLWSRIWSIIGEINNGWLKDKLGIVSPPPSPFTKSISVRGNKKLKTALDF